MTDPGRPNQPTDHDAPPEAPIWLRPWFQWVLGGLALFVFLSFLLPPVLGLLSQMQSVLTPVVFALVLAYIFNPLVTLLARRCKVPRWAGTGLIMAAAGIILLMAMAVAVPLLVDQSSQLILKLKEVYPKVVASVVEEDGPETPADGGEPAHGTVAPGDAPDASGGPDTTAPPNGEGIDPPAPPADPGDGAGVADDKSAFEQLLESEQVQTLINEAMAYVANLDWSTVASTSLQALDIGTGVVGSAISFTTYLIVFATIAAFSFFFLSWKLGEFKAWFVPFIPAQHKARTFEILGKMDRTVSAWLRGRLIQALLLSVMLTAGWAIAGVPYWFLLGVICGVLGLVPYLIFIGWAAAMLLASLDALAAGQFSIWVLVWPTVVYAIAQTIDGWVVEPLLQGKATEMGVLTVLLVVMIGGSLAGLIGLLAAIPVAACVKILMIELVLPKLRALAANQAPG